MNTLRALFSTIICLLLVVTSSAAAAKSIEERKWIRMESEHFVVHSVLTSRSTRDLLKHLEVVYALFLGAAGESTASEVPTTIFALGGERDAEALGWDMDQYVGFFRAGLKRNIVVIREERRTDEASVIVHEFVHYLLSNNTRFPYPSWYQEGYAEYIASNELGASYFDVGKNNQGRSWTLESPVWLPLEELIAPSSRRQFDEKDVRFLYAQSWLLVHFLYSQPNGERLVSQGLRDYTSSIQAGNSPVAAFEEGFGYSLDELEVELRRYKNRGRFQYARFPLDVLLKDFDPVESRVSKEAISLELGWLLVEGEALTERPDPNSLKIARRLFDVAARTPETQALAELGIGYVLEMEGDGAEAESWVTSGAALAAGNYRVQLDAAKFYLERVNRGDFDALKTAEPYLLRAINLDRSPPEIAFSIGMFLLHSGDLERAVGSLEVAARRAPADQRTRLILARAYARTGEIEKALVTARDVQLYSHGYGGIAEAAQELIDELEGTIRPSAEEPE